MNKLKEKFANTFKKNNPDEKSFAEGLNAYKMFWIFWLGCLFGVIIEVIWCIVKNGYIASRTALIFEPLNPVYGFGALILTLLLYKVRNKHILIIFFLSAIIGGGFEYICSLFQELVFGTVSWHYGPEHLGILFGRTSLIYCIYWGILGIAWIKFIYPFLSSKIEKMPNSLGKPLTILLAVIVCFDIVFSSLAVYRQRQRRECIPASTSFGVFLDEYFNDEMLKEIYPNMKIVK